MEKLNRQQLYNFLSESVFKKVKNTKGIDMEDKIDSNFDLENRLIEVITNPKNVRKDCPYLTGGDGDGWVDHIELDCQREFGSQPNYMRKYKNIEDCYIFDEQMSKSRPFRIIKRSYLTFLRFVYKGSGCLIGKDGGYDSNGESNLNHVEVWVGTWNKRDGMSKSNSKPFLFKSFPIDTQREILDYAEKLVGME